ncbi:MAG: hypothetical protein CMI53_01620 [Parcubacteria group bacterium]|nr:hypothetical protein [Parcubacteria group bacterium]|tara:strand:+ start:1493 stop:1984 length:492 start_codon:yes stop_codon:yes gene_type:complete
MIVADSSTLILLAKTELLDWLLENLKEKITIPRSVFVESTIKNEAFDAILIKNRVKENKIKITDVKQKYLCDKLLDDFNFGKGEAEAISLCLLNKAILLVDDKKAIKCCKVFNLKFTTAPNILVTFYKKKIVDKEMANLLLTKLEKYGRYSSDIIQKIKGELK